MPDSEAERLKRLREKQLNARDPLAYERKFQRNMSVKEKRMEKPISLKDEWRRVPYTIKAPLFGLVFGIIGTVILVRLWDWQYAIYVGIAATVFFTVFGLVFGNAIDLRNEIKKQIK